MFKKLIIPVLRYPYVSCVRMEMADNSS